MPPKKKPTTKKPKATAPKPETEPKAGAPGGPEPDPTPADAPPLSDEEKAAEGLAAKAATAKALETAAHAWWSFGDNDKLTVAQYVEACKKAHHVAHPNPDGTLDGPEDAPMFMGNPYMSATNPDARVKDPRTKEHGGHGFYRLIYKDVSGRTATSCAVYVREK